MRVLLFQLDGKLPNIALMRIAAYHRELGDDITFRNAPTLDSLEPQFGDDFDFVYASAIFTRSAYLAARVSEVYRGRSVVGGTGVDEKLTLESIGIETTRQDYSIYPHFENSIGFSQRGCRLRCSFCIVWRKEPVLKSECSIYEIWRGEPHHRNLIILDNDFFGQPGWQEKIEEIRRGDFKVSFTQGINARMLNDETAAAIASIKYYDDSFRNRRIYTAWDNRKDENRLFAGLDALVRHGVKPDQIMVFMLMGYDHKTKGPRANVTRDDLYRHQKLREYGCRPYPMPFIRSRELVGFQRFVVGAYDKRVSWQAWRAANYQPANLGFDTEQMSLPLQA